MTARTAADIKARREARGDADPLNRLRHHVTTAIIDRGQPGIVEQAPATWNDCAKVLNAAGYRHTAGNRYAKLGEGKRKGMTWARIDRDPITGHHTITYL